MFKYLLFVSMILSGTFTLAANETVVYCHSDYWDVPAKVTIKSKISRSVISGNYHMLKAKVEIDRPNFPGASGSTPDRPFMGKYYFRSSDREHIRVIMDVGVYTNGKGEITVIRGSGRQNPKRSMRFFCG